MSAITWNDKMSVNVAEIDKQHKKLIDIINSLSEAMKSGKGKDVIGKIIKQLADYTVYHFGHEEKLFEKYNYPETKAHLAKHKEFVDKLNNWQKQLETGKLALSVQVINYLSSWLREHIMGTDQKYSEFLNEKGVA